MKSSALVPFLGLALLAGAAAGAVTVVLVRAPSGAPPETAALPAPVAAPPAELVARLDALAAENRALRDRLSMLELRRAAEGRAPALAAEGYVSREDFDSFRAELERSLAGLGALPRESGVFEERVADALTTIRQEERVEAVRGRQEQRLQALDDTVRQLERRLQLTPFQSGRMRSALLDQYARDEALIQQWQDGADDQTLGELKRGNAEALRNDLSGFLTQQQLEAFGNRGGGGEK